MSLSLWERCAAPPDIGQHCVHQQVRGQRCRACLEVCPTGAIDADFNLNDENCMRCGRCLFVCPTDALVNLAPPQRSWRGATLTAPLSAIAASLEELLLWHATRGIRAIELATADSAEWHATIAQLNATLLNLNQPIWRVVSPSPALENHHRRRWLGLQHGQHQVGSVKPGRRALRDALPAAQPFTIRLLKEDCYLCGACTRVCPEQALQLEATHFTLDHARCTACGNCHAVCFTGAIDCVSGQREVEPLAVTQQRCTSCHHPFNSWSSQQTQCAVCQRHAFGMREA